MPRIAWVRAMALSRWRWRIEPVAGGGRQPQQTARADGEQQGHRGSHAAECSTA